MTFQLVHKDCGGLLKYVGGRGCIYPEGGFIPPFPRICLKCGKKFIFAYDSEIESKEAQQ